MQKNTTRRARKALIISPLTDSTEALASALSPESPATCAAPEPTTAPEHQAQLDPLLADALKSLETPLELIVDKYLEGAQQELEDSIKPLGEPIPFPSDDDDADSAEFEFAVRCAIASQWGILKQDAQAVVRHLTMLDRLTYCALTEQDPANVADPDQVAELLPVAQLAAAAITRLMSKTKEN